jgi:hypothetical protein
LSTLLATPVRIARPTKLMTATFKPEDILTPEELAARLKVRDSWVYEQNAVS